MDEFIEIILLGRAIQAAFQRGKVYNTNISKVQKLEIIKDIKLELKSISKQYKDNISEADHIRNISDFAETISTLHRDKLQNGKLRIGTAQKLLNVYIKFLWCLGLAKEPVHCPIDSIVLKEIGDRTTKWTDLQTINEYKRVIKNIRQHINGQSIAKWERELWNNKVG